jgi:hypothetical protein
MSILLYCVTEKSKLPTLGPGVAGLPVLSLEHGELAGLFSQTAFGEGWTGAPLKESARQFHHVLQGVFESRAIIPFRFPTLLREPEELTAHIRANSLEYLAQLAKFRTSVQVDITVDLLDPARASCQTSGTKYLRERQKRSEELDRIAEKLYAHVNSATQGWRIRPTPHGLKVLALLDRDSVAVFNTSLQRFPVPPGLSIRISGPWPVTEFLELTQRG